jgi:hypothetical protein
LASASDDKLSASARFICREDMVRSSCSSEFKLFFHPVFG